MWKSVEYIPGNIYTLQKSNLIKEKKTISNIEDKCFYFLLSKFVLKISSCCQGDLELKIFFLEFLKCLGYRFTQSCTWLIKWYVSVN